ncbi:hypothetical protein ACH4PU_07420 [Streptomyces sp. NPDC021100]|uniref:hypothetical protein n=1 Tax=Streptomyces sp. NPDC021100 TaxID=3365114 RepID=UPI003788FD4D
MDQSLVSKTLRAVVFDANALSGGRPDVNVVRLTAELATRYGIEVWIPEPVIWEWVEHLDGEVEKARRSSNAALRNLRIAGIPGKPVAWPGKDEMLWRLEADLLAIPGVVIVRLSGEAARDGLRDQILLDGPGRRKEGVKAGGSDSAWLRDVLSKAGGSFEDLILLSRDADVVAACRGLLVEPPLMMSVYDLRRSLLRYIDCPEGLARLITAHFTDLIVEHDSNVCHYGYTAPDFNLGVVEVDRRLLQSGVYGGDVHVHDVEVRCVRKVLGAHDLRGGIERGAEKRGGASGCGNVVVECTVEFLVDLDVSTYEIDADGEVRMDGQVLYDMRISSHFLVEVLNGEVQDCSPISVAQACPPALS